MSDYDLIYLGKKAEELGFVRDTLEKVIRLLDILEYFNSNTLLKKSLALKGGTAINITIFNLPRLSVDIDMDYLITNSREEMLSDREKIKRSIEYYMLSQGYIKSPKTKTTYSLDSLVYGYTCAGGNKDNIKLEINYSLRSHIFPAEERPIISNNFSTEYNLKSIAPIEIFASKINALLSRAAARDLYDVANMIRLKIFNNSKEEKLRKCVIFYAAITTKKINKTFDTKLLESITQQKIKTELLPVIRRRGDFNLDSEKKIVREYISDLMILSNYEKEFLDRFEDGEYIPELLFKDREILDRIKGHPMAIWKIS